MRCRLFVSAALSLGWLMSCSGTPGSSQTWVDSGPDVEAFDVPRIDASPQDAAGSADVSDAGLDTGADAVCDTLGCPCTTDDECASGYCVDGGDSTGRVCSELCADSCSLPDYECVVLVNSGGDAVRLCVPIVDSFCQPCITDRNCGRLGDVCLELVDGQFCTPDCAADGECPEGGFCTVVEVDGANRSLCVPALEVCGSCVDEDGDGYGVGSACAGSDCDDGSDAVYDGAPEPCDGLDNDCDGFTDEDTDLMQDALHCGACGRVCDAANSASVCEEGECTIATCDDTWVDCDGVAANGCESPVESLNACGGCGPLPALPEEPCGRCDGGAWACSGTDAVVCEGEPAEDVLNACGGCTELAQPPGSACGLCGSGSTACDGEEAVVCVADPLASAANACGGCTTLAQEPGGSCGTCGSGVWACDGADGVVCSDDAGVAALNACGGCTALAAAVGSPCGTCGSGVWACDGAEGLRCEGDAGDAARNACGGCGVLPGSVDGACGTCGSGVLVCDGPEALRCAGDDGPAILNACGGCATLTGVPTTACGTCGTGAWACVGTEAVQCVSDGGGTALNACGGCGALPNAPGSACGTCGSGTVACAGPDATTCVGDDGAAALNACGGCAVLAAAPGASCGTCGDGAWACAGAEAVVCQGATPDSDVDGACDTVDRCPGSDDRLDADGDGVPNGCDVCAGSDDRVDADADGVPNGCDVCSAGPDRADADGDRVPDACDCNQAGCSANATCGELSTGAVCTCVSGFTGDGRTCTPVSCGTLAAPANGTINLTGTGVGATATAACNTGWTLQGSAVRSCTASGAWDGTTATCFRPAGDLWCVCNSLYSVGSRVISVSDFPGGFGSTVGRGRLGTVIAGNSANPPFAVLVQWDGWSDGHSGRCDAARCGACSEGGRSKYWVSCSDIAPAGP